MAQSQVSCVQQSHLGDLRSQIPRSRSKMVINRNQHTLENFDEDDTSRCEDEVAWVIRNSFLTLVPVRIRNAPRAMSAPCTSNSAQNRIQLYNVGNKLSAYDSESTSADTASCTSEQHLPDDDGIAPEHSCTSLNQTDVWSTDVGIESSCIIQDRAIASTCTQPSMTQVNLESTIAGACGTAEINQQLDSNDMDFERSTLPAGSDTSPLSTDHVSKTTQRNRRRRNIQKHKKDAAAINRNGDSVLEYKHATSGDNVKQLECSQEAIRNRAGSFDTPVDLGTPILASSSGCWSMERRAENVRSQHKLWNRSRNTEVVPKALSKTRIICLEDLSTFSERHPQRLVSVYGDIFDVSAIPQYGFGGCMGWCCGNDITYPLIAGLTHPKRMQMCNQFFDIRKEPPAESADTLRILAAWRVHFEEQCGPPIGRLAEYQNEAALPRKPDAVLTHECAVM